MLERGANRQLFFHLHISLLCPRHVTAQEELHFDEVFGFGVERSIVIGQFEVHALTSLHGFADTLQRLVLQHADTVFPERPDNVVVCERFKVVLVENLNLSLLHIDRLDADVLIDFLHFIVLCLGREVGLHDAVHAEHAVVGLVVHAEVAAVAEEAVTVVVAIHRLVHPVPDGAADEEVRAFDGVPIVHEVADGVTHGVSIFRDVVGIFDLVVTLHGTLHPGDGRILVGTHVHDVVVAFVLHGAGGVVGFDGVVGFNEVVARSCLVAETPDGDGGVVHVGAHHFHVAGDVSVLELRNVRETLLAVVVLVTLDVGFIFEIDAVDVAEIVPVGVVGVVAVADVVDVALLHEEDFLLHLSAGNGVTGFGVVLVAVHTLHLDGLTVEVVVATCESELVFLGGCVFDFNFAEADVGGEGFDHLAFGVLQFADQGVALRFLCAPGFHGGAGVEGGRNDDALSLAAHCADGNFGGHVERRVVLSEECVGVEFISQLISLHVLLAQVAHLGFDFEGSAGEGFIVVGNCLEVAHLHHRFGGEGDAAEDAGEAEHVLTFEEGAVAVAIDFDSHHVLALLVQIGRDVKLCQVAGVFREADVFAVDVEIEEGINAVEVDADLFAVPFGGHGERAAIGADLVAVRESEPILRRSAHHAPFPIALANLVLEDDALVGVERFTILEGAVFSCSRHVPTHGYGDVVPGRGVKVSAVEVFRALVGVGSPVELPLSVERAPKAAVFGQHFSSLLGVSEGEEPSVRLLFVVGDRVGALPFPTRRSSHVAVEEAAELTDLCPSGGKEHSRKQRRDCFSHSRI